MDELLDMGGEGLEDSFLETADMNGDGVDDILYMAADLNGDGIMDAELFGAELDGDGSLDVSVLSADTDDTGIMDIESLDLDLDGDGVADIFTSSDSAYSIWEGEDLVQPVVDNSAYDSWPLADASYEDISFQGYEDFYEVHGTPTEDMALWDQQDDPMSCAVATTNMMFSSVGLDVGEDSVATLFQDAGIYNPDIGTEPKMIEIGDVINQLAIDTGLDCHASEFNFTPASLADMLDNGVCPLVGVDAAELYSDLDCTLNEMGYTLDAGHAVQVTGIASGEDGDYVILNDPGIPDGAGYEVPMVRFLDAAEDHDYSGVAVYPGAIEDNGSIFPWLSSSMWGNV